MSLIRRILKIVFSYFPVYKKTGNGKFIQEKPGKTGKKPGNRKIHINRLFYDYI